MSRYVYVALGMITLTLGLLGMITPGLPTTPLILLTGFLFAKGSPKLHQKLLDNRITGRYIRRVNNGLSIKGLLFSIAFMWCMIAFSTIMIFSGTMRFVMIGLGIIGTIAQIIVLGKRKLKKTLIVEDKDSEIKDS